MKFIQIRIVALLAILPMLGFTQTRKITITGNFPASKNGQKISCLYGDFKNFKLDSARITNGKVQFVIKDADSLTVSLTSGNFVPVDHLRMFIGSGNVSFTTKDSLKNAVVSGDPDSEDFHRMYLPVDRLMGERFTLLGKLNNMSAEEQKSAAGQRLNARIKDIAKQERIVSFKAIDDNPDSYIAFWMLENLAGGAVSYDEMMPHFKMLDKRLKSTVKGKALEEKIMLVKNLRSGVNANDFESFTPEGEKLRLSDVYAKSKFTFVDFWASWCAPCRAENPNVVKAYEAYGKKGLNILSVSLDTKSNLWKAAIQKDGMPWLHVSQLKGFDEPAAVLYNIKMIPQNVLIDSKGRIVATNLRGYALEEKLKQLMP